MKITQKTVERLMNDVREDLSKIAEENAERLLLALDEQVRSGGESSITLSIGVEVIDDGAASAILRVKTSYGWIRKVKVKDEYIEHVIDLGPTLFDPKAKEEEAGGVVRINATTDFRK